MSTINPTAVRTLPTNRLPLEHEASAEAHLLGTLEDMAAIYRLYLDDATPADLDRLEIDPERLEHESASDLAREAADAFALEVKVARWMTEPYAALYEPMQRADGLARAYFLLATGGPDVRLTIDFGHWGDQEASRVTLDRVWASARDRAESDDDQVLEMVDGFVRAFHAAE